MKLVGSCNLVWYCCLADFLLAVSCQLWVEKERKVWQTECIVGILNCNFPIGSATGHCWRKYMGISTDSIYSMLYSCFFKNNNNKTDLWNWTLGSVYLSFVLKCWSCRNQAFGISRTKGSWIDLRKMLSRRLKSSRLWINQGISSAFRDFEIKNWMQNKSISSEACDMWYICYLVLCF